MKKTILWVTVGVVAGYLVWWMLPKYFREEVDPRSVEHLSKVAAELNRSVPVMVDVEIELLLVQGAHGMLIYNYRLVKYSVSELDHQKFAVGAKQKVTQGVCNQSEMRDDFFKKGVMLCYSYFDKDKQHIATFEVAPADCGF